MTMSMTDVDLPVRVSEYIQHEIKSKDESLGPRDIYYSKSFLLDPSRLKFVQLQIINRD